MVVMRCVNCDSTLLDLDYDTGTIKCNDCGEEINLDSGEQTSICLSNAIDDGLMVIVDTAAVMISHDDEEEEI